MKEAVYLNLQMDLSIPEISRMENFMEKVFINGLMEDHMKVIGKTIDKMDKVLLNGLMVDVTLEIMLMTKSKDKV